MGLFYERSHFWLLCNVFQVFYQLVFKYSINQFLERRDLTKVIATRLLTSFTFVIQRIFKWKFLIIFCYTEVLFPRHSECNQTNIFSGKSSPECLEKFRKNFQEGKCSNPKSKQYFSKKMYVIEIVLFSVILRPSSASSVSSSIACPLLQCKRDNTA